MKLYDVPCNTYIRIVGETQTPVAGVIPIEGETIKFCHIDGMYSYCKNEQGDTIHLAAWTEVEVVE
jgi:hypothetical protein